MVEISNGSVLGSSIEAGEITDGAVTSSKVGAGFMTLVETKTVTSATQSHTFSSLDSDTDDTYILIYNIVNDNASTSTLSLYLNGDETDANYDSERMHLSGSTLSAGRNNNSQMGESATNNIAMGWGKIWRADSYGVMHLESSRDRAGSVVLLNYRNTTASTISNITSITVKSNQTTGLGVDTVLSLYKITKD